MISLLNARPVLRLAGTLFARPAVGPTFSRATTASSLRTFLTTTSVQFPTAKAKARAQPKDTPKPKSKSTTAKKTPTAKAPTAKKVPANKGKRVKKVVAKPKFDRKLMNPPKRHGTTPYLVFLKEYMANGIKNQISVKDLIKTAAKDWNVLSDAQKQPYSVPIQANKESFEKRYEEWFRALPPGYLRQINIKRKEKGKHIVRRPKSMKTPASNGFIYFYSEYRLANPSNDVSLPQISKNAGAAWQALAEEEKKKYNQRAQKIRSDFIQARSGA